MGRTNCGGFDFRRSFSSSGSLSTGGSVCGGFGIGFCDDPGVDRNLTRSTNLSAYPGRKERGRICVRQAIDPSEIRRRAAGRKADMLHGTEGLGQRQDNDRYYVVSCGKSMSRDGSLIRFIVNGRQVF